MLPKIVAFHSPPRFELSNPHTCHSPPSILRFNLLKTLAAEMPEAFTKVRDTLYFVRIPVVEYYPLAPCEEVDRGVRDLLKSGTEKPQKEDRKMRHSYDPPPVATGAVQSGLPYSSHRASHSKMVKRRDL